ncbi:hypothetical protein DSECCO2_516350 [anaerobic digester metagenome]
MQIGISCYRTAQAAPFLNYFSGNSQRLRKQQLFGFIVNRRIKIFIIVRTNGINTSHLARCCFFVGEYVILNGRAQ